ncbi:hypothetical protein [Streptomyces sp. NPDC004230]
MLILLGAAGGALRGLLDAYTRFLDWQSARRAQRRLRAGQVREPVRFQDYFDPVADPIAAVVHSAMGAGTAVLLGTTGQISGAYAAVVVGISAPVILTQLGRSQSVSNAVIGVPGTGPDPAGDANDPAVEPALPTQWPTPAEPTSQSHAALPITASPTLPSSTAPSPPMAIAESRTDALATNFQAETGAYDPQSNGRPVDAVRERRDGLGSYGAPQHPPRPATGEEGTTR